MTRYTDIDKGTIDAIAALGFDVYMPIKTYGAKTWLYYTDGRHIGYLERCHYGGFTISTVHVPCKGSGTGYRMIDDSESFYTVTRKVLELGFVHIPSWAPNDVDKVRKYRDIEAFLKSQTRDYERVAKGIQA